MYILLSKKTLNIMKKSILFILFLLTIQSCSNEKVELINEYQKMHSIIKEKNFENIYQLLDLKSQEYLTFLTDTSNWEFNKIKNYGENLDLKFTTLEYYYHLKSIFKGEEIDKLILLELFGVTQVPLFNWFKEPRFMEDKTNDEEGDFVIIAYPINDKMFASTKVHIYKNSNGEYKLDIFPLFKVNETLLTQRFIYYGKVKKRENESIEYNQMLIQFFKEKDENKYLQGRVRMTKKH